MKQFTILAIGLWFFQAEPRQNAATVQQVKQLLRKEQDQAVLAPKAQERIEAIKTLAKIAHNVQATSAEVSVALTDPDPTVRAQAAAALSDYGPSAKNVASTLAQALKKETNPDVQLKMIGACAALAPFTKEAIPLVIPFVKSKDARLRFQAVATLGAFRAEGQAGVPALIQALDDLTPGPAAGITVSSHALFCLQQIGPQAKDAVAPVQALLQKKGYPHREAVFKTLAKIAPKDKSLVPLFIKHLEGNGDLKLRAAAANALGVLGPDAADAVPALTEALKFFNVKDAQGAAWVRYEAIMALGEIGPAAKSAIPDIEKAIPLLPDGVEGNAKMMLQKLQQLP